MSDELSEQIPIAFIVEGHDEVASFPSLACRILGGHMHLPCAKAVNNAEIVADLEQLLSQVVIRHHPLSIVVTLDLRDMRDHPELNDCRLLREELQRRADAWLNGRHAARYLPLPRNIQIVIQVQTFETWLLADLEGLKSLGYIRTEEAQHSAVDEIDNPLRTLSQAKGRREFKKSPRLVKEIISALEPSVMSTNSRSFAKFCKEVRRAYGIWMEGFVDTSL